MLLGIVRGNCGKTKSEYSTLLFILLLTVTLIMSSQIYVEIERARLTKTLAAIKEQSGEVKEAASILQELQV